MSHLPPPPPPISTSTEERRRPWLVVTIVASALIVVVSLIAILVNSRSTDVSSTNESPSPSSPEGPELSLQSASGFPDGWVTVAAADGSFGATVPGPGTVSEGPRGGWTLDVHEWSSASCAFYLYPAGSRPNPSTFTRSQLLAWAKKLPDPDGRLSRVRLGSAIGWRTQLSYEHGAYPTGAFQILYAHDWEYAMGCDLPMEHPKSDERLVERFLDSFAAPAPSVTSQP